MINRPIKNVVFDIGNVIVRWSPLEIVKLTFGDSPLIAQLSQSIFQSEIWAQLNRGEISESDAKHQFQSSLGLSTESTDKLFYYVKHTQILLYGSVELLIKIKQAGYKVYALTDNVREIVCFLQDKYDFWPLFDGTIVSAEVGCMKPTTDIYHRLLTDFNLSASETVFLDDMPDNTQGAISLGISAVLFENAEQCEQELERLGLSF